MEGVRSVKSDLQFSLVFIDLFRFEIQWNTCDKEENRIKSNEAREEKIHGIFKTNGVSNLLH